MGLATPMWPATPSTAPEKKRGVHREGHPKIHRGTMTHPALVVRDAAARRHENATCLWVPTEGWTRPRPSMPEAAFGGRAGGSARDRPARPLRSSFADHCQARQPEYEVGLSSDLGAPQAHEIQRQRGGTSAV